MNRICVLENPIQAYAWGSETAIPELLGKKPSGVPQAELWMGAHPKSPSTVIDDGRRTLLPDLIDRYPNEILGENVAQRFGGRLPYLFKVLAAARPLSVQAHPTRDQAKAGFARENRLGIALGAPERNYRDDNHKPECICALRPMWALNGFRMVPDIQSLLAQVCPEGLGTALESLRRSPNSDGLRRFFQTLMTLEEEKKSRIIRESVSRAAGLVSTAACFEWIINLHQAYPSDIGMLSPALLNLVCLKPGEAMFLQAGELHAYLDGVGIELMANSDNVLRGGLTPKHVDVPELLSVLTFEERTLDILSPRKVGPCEGRYDSGADEFVLSVITVTRGKDHAGSDKRSVEILLCTQGRASISDGNRSVDMPTGTAMLVPAASGSYSISGEATIYKATVPGDAQQ